MSNPGGIRDIGKFLLTLCEGPASEPPAMRSVKLFPYRKTSVLQRLLNVIQWSGRTNLHTTVWGIRDDFGIGINVYNSFRHAACTAATGHIINVKMHESLLINSSSC